MGKRIKIQAKESRKRACQTDILFKHKDSNHNQAQIISSLCQKCANKHVEHNYHLKISEKSISEMRKEQRAESLIQFLNNQKYYSKIELNSYIICLANFVNTSPHQHLFTNFTESRTKIKVFLEELMEEVQPSEDTSNRIRAIFYILVAVIYKQKGQAQKQSTFSSTLVTDKAIINLILNIRIPKNDKISKWYGMVILAITGKHYKKQIKQKITRSILLNLKNIQHQNTMFNLLALLRSQKGSVNINIADIKQGELFVFLASSYIKYVALYQSYYILDYLNHLLSLFPSCAPAFFKGEFVLTLINCVRLRNFHHPLQETKIFEIIDRGFKCLNSHLRNEILDLIHYDPSGELFTQSKIAKIIVTHQNCDELVAQLNQNHYLLSLIKSCSLEMERNILMICLDAIILGIRKIAEFNRSIARYLLYLLRNRQFKQDEEIMNMLSSIQSLLQ